MKHQNVRWRGRGKRDQPGMEEIQRRKGNTIMERGSNRSKMGGWVREGFPLQQRGQVDITFYLMEITFPPNPSNFFCLCLSGKLFSEVCHPRYQQPQQENAITPQWPRMYYSCQVSLRGHTHFSHASCTLTSASWTVECLEPIDRVERMKLDFCQDVFHTYLEMHLNI